MTVTARPLPRLQLFSPVRSFPALRPSQLGTTSLYARRASTRNPIRDKSQILEKPDKFRPPSHGRTRRRTQPTYGPSLSDHERHEQSTKWYPNMMPPEGTFLNWFIHNRSLHLWIVLGVLTTLATTAFTQKFLQTTAYRDMLPSSSDFLSHPFRSFSQFIQVYKLHVAHESEKVAETRRRKLEDVKKREEFQRTHGLDPGFVRQGWLAKLGTVEQDEQREKDAARALDSESALRGASREIDDAGTGLDGSPISRDHDELERKAKRPLKKWLGIW